MNYFNQVWKDALKFNGRSRRSEFWYFTLISTLISIVIGVIGQLMDYPNLQNLYTIANLLPSIAVGIRRMHDVGKSGWFLLIPIYNLVLACTEGTKGENEYGHDPKATQ